MWLTIMIFALTPLFFFLMSSQDKRDIFYEYTRRELEKKIMLDIRTTAQVSNINKLKQIVFYAENTLKIHINFFDSSQNEIFGQEYPEYVPKLLDEMADGKLVLIKSFSDDPEDARRVRVIKAGKYIFSAVPSDTEKPAYLNLMIAQHLHIFLYIVLLSSIASLIMSRFFTKPLNTLGSAAESIADGNFDINVSETMKRKDEFGQLAQDFDTMAERLRRNKETHEEMLRNISHELRSPLTRLRISLELARSKAGDDVHTALDRIESESEKLNEMIGWLLELSRLKEQVKPPREELSVCEEIRDIIADAEFEAKQNGKILKSDILCSLKIKANKHLLKSGMENIIRNAIKYASSTIKVKAMEENGNIIISVCDDGEGLDKKHMEDIFTPFYRVCDDRDRKTGGTGLGLAIAKAFADTNNGKIRAYNVPDSGLCVEITIPVSNT